MIVAASEPTINTATRTEKGEDLPEVSILSQSCETGIPTQDWTYQASSQGTKQDWMATYAGAVPLEITVGEATCAMTHIALGFFHPEDPSIHTLQLQFEKCSPPLTVVVPLESSANSTFALAEWMCAVEKATTGEITRPCQIALAANPGTTTTVTTAAATTTAAAGASLTTTGAAAAPAISLDVKTLIEAVREVQFEQYSPPTDASGCFEQFSWMVSMNSLGVSSRDMALLDAMATAMKGSVTSLEKPAVQVAIHRACILGCDGECPLTKVGFVETRSMPWDCFSSSEVMPLVWLLWGLLLLLGVILGCFCTRTEEKRKPIGFKAKDGKFYQEVDPSQVDPMRSGAVALTSTGNMITLPKA